MSTTEPKGREAQGSQATASSADGEASSFSISITATASDIDELGHVSNITYVRWIQDVAKGHSNAAGWSYAQYRELGAVFVVRRHEVDYLAAAMEGDEPLASTHVASWSGASCIRKTKIERRADQRLLAAASTQWALVSVGADGSAMGRPRRIPSELRAAFSNAIPIL